MKILYKVDPAIVSLPDEQRITSLIPELNKIYSLFMPWAQHPQAYAVQFEELVGPQGD